MNWGEYMDSKKIKCRNLDINKIGRKEKIIYDSFKNEYYRVVEVDGKEIFRSRINLRAVERGNHQEKIHNPSLFRGSSIGNYYPQGHRKIRKKDY